MKPRTAGHLLQLLGYVLVFLGMGIVLSALVASTSYPSTPFWMFVVLGAAIGAPLMIAGSRYDSRGRALLFDIPAEEALRLYHQQNKLMAIYLALLWLQGFWVAAPIFFYAFGWVDLQSDFTKVWLAFWIMLFCGGRQWITHPLMRWVARRIGS
jgi:hypothetical protein